MKRFFTEQDLLFRDETPDSVIEQYLLSGPVHTEGVRSKLNKALKKAKSDGKPVILETEEIICLFDKKEKEYSVIQRNRYNPANLLSVLFDLVVTPPNTDLELTPQQDQVKEDIDAYFRKIEESEGMVLEEQKNNILELVLKMQETLFMINEEELSEAGLETVAEEVDKRFYQPLAEQLEKILDEIDIKNKS